jgi:hypothetical protein
VLKYDADDVGPRPVLLRAHELKLGSLQKNVDLANTFEPTNMSLPKEVYEMMIDKRHLPFHWIETSSCVGPFFWSTVTELDGTPRFRTYPDI